MSLGKTLLKVAIGIALVKGASALAKGAQGGGAANPGSGTRYDPKPGGIEDMMGDILGGSARRAGHGPRSGSRNDDKHDTGGLGDLLEQISGQRRTATTRRRSAPQGGLDDLLGQITGGTQKGQSGGVGDLLGEVLGSGSRAGREVVLPEPQREEELSAAVLLRAVIQAVKSDGSMDEAEKQKLVQAMGDATETEVRAVNAELSRPLDVEALVAEVPAGMEAQVYAVSLMAIDLDHKEEAQYLHALAQALELTPEEVNALHKKAGEPPLYR